MKKINRLFLSMISFLSVFTFFSSSMTVLAVPSKEEIYEAAPEGVELDDYMSAVTEYNKGGITVQNGAKINRANTTYKNPYDIIQMLSADDGKSQLSSIWGARKEWPGVDSGVDNYFDLSKDQTISAWLYFGQNYAYNNQNGDNSIGTDPGMPDGMAFVLQNDPDGNKAISYSINDGKPAIGETLGVWGNASSNFDKLNSIISIGSGGIKRSVAVEFDSFRNVYTNKDDFFDGMLFSGSAVAKGQHIAWGYPNGMTEAAKTAGVFPVNPANDTNSYLGNSSKLYYGMNHRNVIQQIYLGGESNINEAWHHFSLDYTAPKDGSTQATIHYIFNDKNYDGTVKPDGRWDDEYGTIDISKLITPDPTDPDSYKVNWGFTASTGSQNSAPADFGIVMQEMPNVANVEVTTRLFDLSQYNSDETNGREIFDLSNKSLTESSTLPKYNVANQDKLRFDYNLEYLAGFAGTGTNITTKLNLPKSVDYTPDPETELGQSGAFGQIIYSNFSDPSDNKTVPIISQDIASDGKGNYWLDLTLNKLDTVDQNIKVEIFGRANATTTPKTVASEHVAYKSMRFVEDSMSPSFIINERFNLTTEDNLNLGTLNIMDPVNNQVNLNLTANYEKGTAFDKKNFTLYTKVDDKAATSTVISTADQKTSYDISNNIANSTMLTANYLGVGTHKITVLAVDSMGRTTTPITYTVTVQGVESKLDVDPEVSFRDIHYEETKGYVNRSGNWKVKVESTDTPWTLTATADPLTMEDDTTQVVGPMFFRDKAGVDHTLENETPIIATYDNADPSSRTTDVGGSWGDDDGILLESEGVKKAGHYTSQIKWVLTNSL